MSETGKSYSKAVESACDDGILRAFLSEDQDRTIETAAAALCDEFVFDDLRDFVLTGAFIENVGRNGVDHSTPGCITDLAIRVLDIHDGESVADLCCGVGGFLASVGRMLDVSVYGVELNPRAAMVARATLSLLNIQGEIDTEDILKGVHEGAFDKVFSNFPFGMRTAALKGAGKYYDIARSGKEGIGRSASSDWLFALAVYDSLKENGKAFVVMTNGAMFNGADKRARRYFVDNGMIETVIALPGNLFQGTFIPTTAMILGNNDGAIRMVDASDLSIEGRRWDSIGKDEIDEIASRIGEDGVFSCMVDRQTLAATEYSLCPSRYQGREIDLENPTSIEDITVAIERGSGYRANELDAMTTSEDTGFSYLKLGDIADGIISSELTNLIGLDQKTEKQWLRTGDLVISKNGAPFKIAVADIAEGRKVLANGNLYILRVDSEKADPYYVAAFLASEDGKELMNREVVGTAIPNLPVSNLKRLKIALPPLSEQKRIGALYHARLDNIEVLRIKLEKARIALGETYRESVGR